MSDLTVEENKLVEEFKHKCKMVQLMYIRETEEKKHAQELERMRIGRAEQRKQEEVRFERERELIQEKYGRN